MGLHAIFVPQVVLMMVNRWWSREVLGCLHRAMALKVWTNLDFESPTEQPYEWALGALDLFVLTPLRPGDIEDVSYDPRSPRPSLTRDRFLQSSITTWIVYGRTTLGLTSYHRAKRPLWSPDI